MSFAIIRNAKCKMSNLQSTSRHNERQNKEYGNKDIDTEKSHLNYHLKAPTENSYEKEFEKIRKENDLKGNLRLTGKKQSNVACEFLITSDSDFFKEIGSERTRQFFKDSYEYACKKCGEKNIISAVVHMDEKTPHMHLTYIPVVKGLKKGKEVNKINSSEFWKGFNSYGTLQDEFHEHCISKGYNLQRGEKTENPREHLSVNKLKAEKLQEKINSLENKIVEINSRHQSTVKTFEKAQKKVNEQFEALKGNYEASKKKYEVEHEALQKKYENLQNKYSIAQEEVDSKLKDLEKTSQSLSKLQEHTKSVIGRLDNVKAERAKIPFVKGLTISEEDYSVLRTLAKHGESKALENLQLKTKVANLESTLGKKNYAEHEKDIKLQRLNEVEGKYLDLQKRYRNLNHSFERVEKALDKLDITDKVNDELKAMRIAEKSMSKSFDRGR